MAMFALYHGENGELIEVTITDRTPGKHGFTYVTFPDGKFEGVEDYRLAWGSHDKEDCEICTPFM